jgi:hypothetical protein
MIRPKRNVPQQAGKAAPLSALKRWIQNSTGFKFQTAGTHAFALSRRDASEVLVICLGRQISAVVCEAGKSGLGTVTISSLAQATSVNGFALTALPGSSAPQAPGRIQFVRQETTSLPA